jgi:hypothetical protein
MIDHAVEQRFERLLQTRHQTSTFGDGRVRERGRDEDAGFQMASWKITPTV